jgi:hypothetical protein
VRWRAGLWSLGRAVRFVAGTVAGRLVALTVALCAVLSCFEVGIGYREKALVGAALAVGASVAGAATGAQDLAERRADGAVALRALLGATAVGGLAVYGLAQLLPGAWWLLLPLGAVGVLACAAGLAFRAAGPPEPPRVGPRLTDA